MGGKSFARRVPARSVLKSMNETTEYIVESHIIGDKTFSFMFHQDEAGVWVGKCQTFGTSNFGPSLEIARHDTLELTDLHVRMLKKHFMEEYERRIRA